MVSRQQQQRIPKHLTDFPPQIPRFSLRLHSTKPWLNQISAHVSLQRYMRSNRENALIILRLLSSSKWTGRRYLRGFAALHSPGRMPTQNVDNASLSPKKRLLSSVLISLLNARCRRQVKLCLAEELRGQPVGKNWTGQFVKRHQDK